MRVLLACGTIVLLLANLATAGDAKSDLAKLQGKWIAEKDGKKSGAAEFDKDTFKFTLYFNDQELVFKGTFKIDPSKKPKHMDLTVKEGPMFEGQTAMAVYDLKDDKFYWCAGMPGSGKRPEALPAKEGDGEGEHLFMIFKKAK